MCSTNRTWPNTVLGEIIGQVLKLVHNRFREQHSFITCWLKMAVLRGGGVCHLMIRSMYLHRWALRMGGQKSQNLIFTGCSHKAIAKHAGLSTAQLHQEFQQQVVKAKFLWSFIEQHRIGKIRYRPRWEKRKTICQQCGEERSCERQLVCSDRHSNYWGKPLWFKLLFYGWILVQNQKTEPFHYAWEKSKTATKTAKTDEKEKKPSNGSKKTRIRRWGQGPSD